MGERSHRSRKLANSNILDGGFQPLLLASKFFIPNGDFPSEGHWFPMDAMRTSNHECLLMGKSQVF